MNEDISPAYQMELISKLSTEIFEKFVSYKKVLFYIKKWQFQIGYNVRDENFSIEYKGGKNGESNIDLEKTLHNMNGELLVKIAIDLGIETPDFIPCIPIFKNNLKEDYKVAFKSFDKAYRNLEQDPGLAIGLANSTLESIIKHILEDKNIGLGRLDKKDTLYNLSINVLKEFGFSTKDAEISKEIKGIGSALLSIAQNIEKLRSDKTNFHGKTDEDYLINDPIYAYFIVNIVSSVGLFLINFYNKKYKKLEEKQEKTSDIDIEDIPF